MFDAEAHSYMWKKNIPRVALEIFNREASEFIVKTLRDDGIKAYLSKCSDGGFRIDITGNKNVNLLFKLYPFKKLCPPRAG